MLLDGQASKLIVKELDRLRRQEGDAGFDISSSLEHIIRGAHQIRYGEKYLQPDVRKEQIITVAAIAFQCVAAICDDDKGK